MHILIRVLEGNQDLHINWIKDMAVGKTNPCQNLVGNTEIDRLLDMVSILQDPQHRSKIASHPPEITIYTSPSSYEIRITEE